MDCKERERMADTPSIKVPLVRLVCKNSQGVLSLYRSCHTSGRRIWSSVQNFILQYSGSLNLHSSKSSGEVFSPRTFLLFSRK